MINGLRDALNNVNFQETIRKAKEEAERVKKEEEAKRKQKEEARWRKEQEEWFYNFWHPGQQSSSSIESAFLLLQLSTRATVQEVKRAFKRHAKTMHPDVGGSEEQFKKLNNAYEVALQHAKGNER